MTPKPDIAVYSPDHRLQLVVEVKGTPDAGEDWAAKLRRNLLAHAAIPASPYFLLVLPERLYLWSHAAAETATRPDYQASTRQVLFRYLLNEAHNSPPLGERSLELAVRAWLSDLTDPQSWSQLDAPEERWLKTSGLVDRIRTGVVEK